MDVSLRVLLAVHGHEPTEWGTRACRVISEWKEARRRVVGVVDVPRPPLTSVMPRARRLYSAARNAWRNDEARRVQGAIDRVTRMLLRRLYSAARNAWRNDEARRVQGAIDR